MEGVNPLNQNEMDELARTHADIAEDLQGAADAFEMSIKADRILSFARQPLEVDAASIREGISEVKNAAGQIGIKALQVAYAGYLKFKSRYKMPAGR